MSAQGMEGAGGPPAPRANPRLVGHEAAEARLIAACDSNRMPHAWMLAGPRGVGKATLAFRFARWLIHRAETGAERDADGPGLFGAPEPVAAGDLAIDPAHRVFRMVASGGHPGLLTIERGVNAQRKRRYTEIRVDDVRKLGDFMHLTTADGGWRIVVVDSADEMNRNAANAILKLLEEPPRRSVILLIAHAPGRLLPTIRSRCRMLRLPPLPDAAVAGLLTDYLPGIDAEEARRLAVLAEGSIGRALVLAGQDGLSTVRGVVELLADAPSLDRQRLLRLAETWSRTAKEDEADPFETGTELMLWWLHRAVRLAVAGQPGGAAIDGEERVARHLVAHFGVAEIGRRVEAVTQFLDRGAALNQDKRQMVLDAFLRLAA